MQLPFIIIEGNAEKLFISFSYASFRKIKDFNEFYRILFQAHKVRLSYQQKHS